jgi:hypothetical protein
MLAGTLLFSAVIGMLAVAATLVMSMPLWMTLLAYPAACSLTLLLTAALISIRSGQAARQRSVATMAFRTDSSLG